MVDLNIINEMIYRLIHESCKDGSRITDVDFWEVKEGPLRGTIHLNAVLLVPDKGYKFYSLAKYPPNL